MVSVNVFAYKTSMRLNVNGLIKNWEEGRGFRWDDMYMPDARRAVHVVLRTADMHFILSAANRALMGLVKATGIADKEVSKTETTILL